jgi:hypothetical protein
MANTEAVARLEGQFGHLVVEFNLMEEDEFQSHEMVHPPQESLEQHFPTAHVDDLEERANQLMAAKHAYTQLSHTHTPHQSCDDCSFINYYMTEVD